MAIDHYGFLKRLRDMQSHLNHYKFEIASLLNESRILETHLAIHRVIFEKYSRYYVTEWMGAMCVGLMDECGLSVSTKLNDKSPVGTLEYIDLS